MSSNDFLLASKFDINNDGKLDTDERTLLRKSMVNTLMKKYNSVRTGLERSSTHIAFASNVQRSTPQRMPIYLPADVGTEVEWRLLFENLHS